MARLLPPENFYENSSNNEKPYKWASVEVLKSNKYSKQSGKFLKNSQKNSLIFLDFFTINFFLILFLDVWAFAVTLWELFSNASPPYLGMTNGEATEKVLSGYRLPIPEKCPTEIYELMCKCWNETPSMRPSMKEVFNEIEKAYFKIKPRKFQESSRVIESGVEDGLYNN